MQTGTFKKAYLQKEIHKETPITGIYTDILNHDLISCDSHTIAKWDFYSGGFTNSTEVEKGIKFIKGDPFVNLLLIAQKSSNVIKLLEVQNLKFVREFKGHKKTV